MWNGTIHENEISTVSLSGRERKMIISSDNFSRSEKVWFGIITFPTNQLLLSRAWKRRRNNLYFKRKRKYVFQ